MIQTAPGPTAKNGIDKGRNQGRVDQVSAELGTLSYGTGNDGGCGRGKHGLEHPESVVPGFRIACSATEEKVGGTEEAVGSAEHKTETDSPEGDGADREIHQVFHQDVAGVFGAG